MAAAATLELGPIAALPDEQDPLAALHSALEHPPTTAVRAAGPVRAQLVGPDGTSHEIPDSVYQVLVRVVHQMVQGHAVSIVPVHAELTTQQAADLLNVSRPHLVKLLEDGLIPYSRPAKHRRVRLDDLMAYKKRQAAERRAALDELAAEAARLGLRY
jgi:excisionase family DNA binding protein